MPISKTKHVARFPGTSNDITKLTLNDSQAVRLAEIAQLPHAEVARKDLATVAKLPQLDPSLLFGRRICGQVVKTDADGNELPVPFATVTVYDTDFNLLCWSPLGSKYSWFYPFGYRREKLATVTTDECGRFCVWVPRFDIDYCLRWRLERRCYLEWLRIPTIEDLIRVDLDPQLRAAPIELDPKRLAHVERLLEPRTAMRLREVADRQKLGSLRAELDDELQRPAFAELLRPPLDAKATELLNPKNRPQLAAKLGLSAKLLETVKAQRVYGPFLRCRYEIVPEWHAIIDVPDLTFEVTQDVDGDGQQEVIYSEGLFDVRWNAGALGEVKLEANPTAIAGPSCDLPDVGECGTPAILFASNYPLQVPGATPPSDFHNASTGYALQPNQPRTDGVTVGSRTPPARSPFLGSFFLMGCADRQGATHYRVHHRFGATTGFLNGSYRLLKFQGGTLHQRIVSPEAGQWYPIVRRAEGWTPVGILAPVDESSVGRHEFWLEFGGQSGGSITADTGSATAPVGIYIDGSAPTIDVHSLEWRHSSNPWISLPLSDCMVIQRNGSAAVRLRLQFTVTANHLRDYTLSAAGCGSGGVAPVLLGAGPTPDDRLAHWHTSPSDNTVTRTLEFELPAGAPAGCYHFNLHAMSRAFRSTDARLDWNYDTAPVYRFRQVTFAIQ